MLTVIGIILLGLIVFVAAGLFGWLLELLKYIFQFLWLGITKSVGCLFWIFVILCVLIVLFY